LAAQKQVIESDGWVPFVASQWFALHKVPETTGAKALAHALVMEAWLTAVHVLKPLAPGPHSKHTRRGYRIIGGKNNDPRCLSS
jgi:hypothetical protein